MQISQAEELLFSDDCPVAYMSRCKLMHAWQQSA